MSEGDPHTHPDIVEHLKMIQNVIDRMALNSFWLRGWNATLAVGWLAFVERGGVEDALVQYGPILPLLMLFFLDGYYLHQERLFRRLYDRVRQQTATDFAMDTAPFLADEKYGAAVFSRTTLFFHGALGILLALTVLLQGGAIG